jgi:hypothetical protein
MRYFQLVGYMLPLLLMAACQSSPPTVVYIVVSPTPADATLVTPADNEGPIVGAQPTATLTTSVAPTQAPVATLTPDIFPTQTVAQIQVAEQVYENGRMMWVQPVGEIWVMVIEEDGVGQWIRYTDTFDEATDPETDPDIVAPEGFIQPERGFGKLWRENPEIRDALGWAITPEFGYISQYEYYPGGEARDDEYIPGFGYHILFSLNGESFRFDEETSTWELAG